jgi:hypothetical protein
MKEESAELETSLDEVPESSRTRKVTAAVAAGAVTIAITTLSGVLSNAASSWVHNRIDPANKEKSDC